jgi:protein TonB
VIDTRLLICAAASVLGHFVLGEALSALPRRAEPVIEHKIEIRVVAAPQPPPPEPEKLPEPVPEAKPEPKVIHEKPTPRPVQATVHDVIPKDTPIADHAVVATESNAQPVFGVSMESTSQAGGPAMPVGNTTQPQPGPAAPVTSAKPKSAPVTAYEVTKMPLPQGRCTGKYTEAARTAAIEGTVVLDLIVDEKGHARDIKVVQGLGGGLTDAAITALRECEFSPGEKDGAAVAVRVRGFKIRFVMADAQ